MDHTTAEEDRSHFNRAPQFSWTDYETRVSVTSADIRAAARLVSISLGMAGVFFRGDAISSGELRELRWLSPRTCSADMVSLVSI